MVEYGSLVKYRKRKKESFETRHDIGCAAWMILTNKGLLRKQNGADQSGRSCLVTKDTQCSGSNKNHPESYRKHNAEGRMSRKQAANNGSEQGHKRYMEKKFPAGVIHSFWSFLCCYYCSAARLSWWTDPRGHMLSIQLFTGVKDGEFGTIQQLVGEDEQGSYYHGETTTSHQKVALDEILFMQHHF